jgi:class 3 adenylate cyclase/tetratricopeptide (TPR) repeat protein
MSTSDVVTVLFTDLVGSTELRATLGDEAADELRRAHDRVLFEAVDTHGGKVIKGLGDGIMAGFDGAADALAAALAIQRGADRLSRRSSGRLSVRVGISVGDVTWEDSDLFGVPVIEAARLCAAAEGGQILAADLVRAMTRGRGGYEFEPVGDLELKGLPEPVPTLALTWSPSPAEEVLPPALATSASGPFVGRDAELEALVGAWKQAKDGSLRAVMVAGEPGVGKTRLSFELARRVHDDGGTVLYGRCEEELGVPYQPFAEALRPYVAECPLHVLTDLAQLHGGELTRLVPELARRLPNLPPPLEAEPEAERYRLFEAVAGLVATASQEAPVLFVIDDLHWAAKPTLLLLHHLIARQEAAAALIVGTYRDTDVGMGGDTRSLVDILADMRRVSETVDRVALDGLDAEGVTAFVEAAAGHVLEEPGLALARAVHAETEGNPFFVGQVLRHLAETGAVSMHDGQWTYDGSVERLRIPDGVREVIDSRRSRLGHTANSVLQIASVIGRDFEFDVLERVSDASEDEVLTSLEEATAARIVGEVPDALDRYTFVHALVRDTIYDELPASRRVRLHRRVAEAVEGLRADDLNPHLAQLAYHFGQAGDAGGANKAVEYASRAGDEAIAQLAYETAADHYRRALDTLERNQRRDDFLRCELLIALGEAHNHAGEVHRGKKEFFQAADLARELDRPYLFAHAALGYGGVLPPSNEPDPRAEALLREVLERVPEDNAVRARALARLAQWLYYVSARPERAELCDEALRIARHVDDPSTIATVLIGRCWALEGPEDLKGQLETAAEVVELGESLDDQEIVLQGLKCRLHRLFERGDVDGAATVVSETKELAGALRQPEYLRLATMWEGMTAGTQGRFEDAERMAMQTLTTMSGHPHQQRVLFFQTLPWRWLQGRISECLPPIEQAVTPGAPPFWDALLAWLYAETGQLDRARDHLSRFDVSELRPEERRYNWWTLLTSLANATDRLHDEHWATELYSVMLPYRERNCTAGQTAFFGAAAHYLGAFSAVRGRWDDAVEHFTSALERHQHMQARPFVALTETALADALTARGSPRDRSQATELHRHAMATVRDLNLRGIEDRPHHHSLRSWAPS